MTNPSPKETLAGIAQAEDVLARMPSDATVVAWMRSHKAMVLDMLPGTDKKRRQYIAEL